MRTTKFNLSERLKPINRSKEINEVTSVLKKIPPRVVNELQRTKTNRATMTPEFRRLIHGDFKQDFSKQNSRLFRVFISSTFSDFKIERNELYRRVFPAIQQRCAQLGYEFQVVDMRLESYILVVQYICLCKYNFNSY
jgi:hypothetical protein